MRVSAVKMGRIPKVDKERALAAHRQGEHVVLQRPVDFFQRMYPAMPQSADGMTSPLTSPLTSPDYAASYRRAAAAAERQLSGEAPPPATPPAPPSLKAVDVAGFVGAGHYSPDVIRELMAQVIERGHGQQLQDTIRQLLSSVQRQGGGAGGGGEGDPTRLCAGFPAAPAAATPALLMTQYASESEPTEDDAATWDVKAAPDASLTAQKTGMTSTTTTSSPAHPPPQHNAVSSTSGLVTETRPLLPDCMPVLALPDVATDDDPGALRGIPLLSPIRKQQPPPQLPLQSVVAAAAAGGVACFDPREFDQYLYPRQKDDVTPAAAVVTGDGAWVGADDEMTSPPLHVLPSRLALYEDTLRHLATATELHSKELTKETDAMRDELAGTLPVGSAT